MTIKKETALSGAGSIAMHVLPDISTYSNSLSVEVKNKSILTIWLNKKQNLLKFLSLIL